MPGKGSENIAKRSLDGLVAFLTCLFPYLFDLEAVRYLDAADADPLVAALHIINRRGMVKFNKNSPTVLAAIKAALRCAAIAAEDPDPQQFMEGWMNISPGVGEFATKLSFPMARHDDESYVWRLIVTPTPDLELEEPWKLANVRLAKQKPIRQEELPPARPAKKRMLLATIHRFYLKALGSLPESELRERLHYSMLQGGHCFGPLDPVSNIIVNTLWYDHKFPISKQVTLQMTSTQCLWRVAARSLYGLVSFLCTRYPSLTPDQALQRLLDTGANLQDADPYLFSMPEPENKRPSCWSGCLQIGSGKPDATAPSVSVPEAYLAAATAAFHSNPLSHREFLASPNTVANLQTARRVMRLQDGRLLSSKDLEMLCMCIFECPSSAGFPQKQLETEPKKVNIVLYTHVNECRCVFWRQQKRASRMVAAALSKFNETAVGFFYSSLLLAPQLYRKCISYNNS
ncbi:hypothetical protein HU200_060788 [Digitaria exilis]|uniref:PIR2-like helical domain-containing protein n=1 Tax=Digitaria exilis TaxID=1010633 RepID=A0A835AA50_9POAL|nr:hypothetical protein HU200_060788 [Digitaria exilis]